MSVETAPAQAGAEPIATVRSLAPHVYLAVLGDDVVILDTTADAYMCVPAGAEILRPSPDRGAVAPGDPSTLEALQAAGLLMGDAAPPRALLLRPATDAGAPLCERMTPTERMRLMGALWDLAWRYRGRRLAKIIAFVDTEGRRRAPSPAGEVVRLARLFANVAPWLPMPRKCLARSFVLLRFLQRSGHRVQWVFGVTTWPFSAHCWLQSGEVVLDDSADRLLEYEPIAAVG